MKWNGSVDHCIQTIVSNKLTKLSHAEGAEPPFPALPELDWAPGGQQHQNLKGQDSLCF